MTPRELWQRYQRYLCRCESIGLRLDVSRMRFADSFFDEMADRTARAIEAMHEIERGAHANADERRMVGHYWLRAPERAPTPAIGDDIKRATASVHNFVRDIHSGTLTPPTSDGFFVALIVGIGGSALGPRLVCDALTTADDPMMIRFIDNTDPDGIERTLSDIGELLPQTLTIVISKSGSTRETYNAMREVAAAYKRAGLDFGRHAVAVTQESSRLHRHAVDEEWLRTFPMWDWVGGRTSVTSAAGLLPAALQGVDVEEFLAGARACDEVTRSTGVLSNPAALLALMWYYAGDGKGRRDMVVLPYRDRLALFGNYLQQLVMESVGKERDRAGNVVHQGLTVYGNKGTSDQHSFIQQLVDGIDNFFVTFIEVLSGAHAGDRSTRIEVADHATTGDYLHAFLHGTRDALSAKDRESITITLEELTPRSLGVLIALFERAVGLYAELIDVNAYNQPGVEAGKKAADRMIEIQRKTVAYLGVDKVGSDAAESDLSRIGSPQERSAPSSPTNESGFTAEEIADAIGEREYVEAVYHMLRHLAADKDRRVRHASGSTPSDARFSV